MGRLLGDVWPGKVKGPIGMPIALLLRPKGNERGAGSASGAWRARERPVRRPTALPRLSPAASLQIPTPRFWMWAQWGLEGGASGRRGASAPATAASGLASDPAPSASVCADEAAGQGSCDCRGLRGRGARGGGVLRGGAAAGVVRLVPVEWVQQLRRSPHPRPPLLPAHCERSPPTPELNEGVVSLGQGCLGESTQWRHCGLRALRSRCPQAPYAGNVPMLPRPRGGSQQMRFAIAVRRAARVECLGSME